uniref:Uncharacterized protein n=1 Tax=Mycena chlorophos TaxID=658473 RepID=A0ABQ0KWN6_MYCCL|nr:predicted protein [Mycena chlorophos]
MAFLVRHQSPFAQTEPPPTPVALLLAHTDIIIEPGPGLLMHEDLPDTVQPLKRTIVFAENATVHTYPPQATVAPADKISKPTALSRGKLETFDEWKESNAQTEIIRISVKQLANKHLDTTKAFSAQQPQKVNLVRAEAREKHPVLGKYEDTWPVDVLLMAHLKSMSREAKKAEDDAVNAIQELALIQQAASSRRFTRKSLQLKGPDV